MPAELVGRVGSQGVTEFNTDFRVFGEEKALDSWHKDMLEKFNCCVFPRLEENAGGFFNFRVACEGALLAWAGEGVVSFG